VLEYKLMSTQKKRAMLIYNANAGQIWGAFSADAVCEYLAKHDWAVDARATDYAGHGSELARQAVKAGFEVVIAAGGDGTINEIIQALAQTSVQLGVLPVGTTNVLARELRIPLAFQEALEYLPIAESYRVDLGRANRRYFILMAGIGYDAEVVRDINPQLKAIAGKSAVVTSGVMNLFQHQPFKVKLRFTDAQGRRHRLRRSAMQIFLFNAATYATDYKIAAEASMDDGLLDLHIYKSKRFQDTLHGLLSLVLRRHKEWTDFEHFSVRSVQVYAKTAASLQLDGDVVGTTPVTIDIVPKALSVLRPRLLLA